MTGRHGWFAHGTEPDTREQEAHYFMSGAKRSVCGRSGRPPKYTWAIPIGRAPACEKCVVELAHNRHWTSALSKLLVNVERWADDGAAS